MDNLYTTGSIADLARTCILLGEEPRPELFWLKSRYKQIQGKYGLKSKTATDSFLYEKMYGVRPEKPSQTLKIRYWRTGKYTPGNRKQCEMLGKALELTEPEMQFLIQGYSDRSLDVYNDLNLSESPLYAEKLEYMQELIKEYISSVPEKQLRKLHISTKNPEHFFRHLYFTDAFHFIDFTPEINSSALTKHIVSSGYDSEFTRQMRLLGEIPRKTFIRHMLILGMPDMTLSKLNSRLHFFGYLPLMEEHTMTGGERLDWLLIQLLNRYEKLCQTEEKEVCLKWFQKASAFLDLFFMREGYPKLRFMYFKSLGLLNEHRMI